MFLPLVRCQYWIATISHVTFHHEFSVGWTKLFSYGLFIWRAEKKNNNNWETLKWNGISAISYCTSKREREREREKANSFDHQQTTCIYSYRMFGSRLHLDKWGMNLISMACSRRHARERKRRRERERERDVKKRKSSEIIIDHASNAIPHAERPEKTIRTSSICALCILSSGALRKEEESEDVIRGKAHTNWWGLLENTNQHRMATIEREEENARRTDEWGKQKCLDSIAQLHVCY